MKDNIKLRNNSWKPYVYIVFTTGVPHTTIIFFNPAQITTDEQSSNSDGLSYDVHVVLMFKCQGHCSELWGMGAEGFRRAPMMHQKVPTLGRTNYTIDETRRINGKEEIDTKALLGTTST